jgi:dTDP-4-amino-4,6-dideoxygalactose transaminase
LVLPKVAANADHVYHLFVVRTPHRDKLQTHLNANGIGTLIHYPIPPHLQKAYKYLGYKEGDFPIAEELAKTMMSLPLWVGMGKNSLHQINSIVNTFKI